MTTILAGLPPVQLYQIITKDEPSYVSKYVAASPQATNDLAYFQANAAKFTTVDSLMKDTRALSVVLTAFGLQSDLNSAGLIKKVMTENPNTTTSVAYQTGNVALAKLGTAMGQWTTEAHTGKTKETFELSFMQRYQKLEGGAQFGTLRAGLRDARMNGSDIRFSFMDQQGMRRDYTGKISGPRMQGTFVTDTGKKGRWSAVRT